MSNIKNYRYDWIWEKTKPIGFGNCNKMPLKSYETISLFYKKLPTYNPQGLLNIKEKKVNRKSNEQPSVYGKTGLVGSFTRKYTNYPRQILRFSNTQKNIHPTQKTIELMEYLIKTYTNENETVLDFTMGSGSTLVACKNLNRNGIGIEKDPQYYAVAVARVDG
jgi:site-specific DNA-methyltransferase (adenine-specific)